MVAETGRDWPPARTSPADHAHPGAVRLPERVGHLRPPAGVALPGVVEQTRKEQVVVGDAVAPQRGDHVEAVAAVGDMHQIEQRELCGCEPGRQSGALLGPDPARTCDRNWRASRGPPGVHEVRR